MTDTLKDRVQQCMLVCHMERDCPPSSQEEMNDEDFPMCVCVAGLHTSEWQEMENDEGMATQPNRLRLE